MASKIENLQENWISIDPSGEGKTGIFANFDMTKNMVINENTIFQYVKSKRGGKILTIDHNKWLDIAIIIGFILKINNVQRIYIEDVKFLFSGRGGKEIISTIKLIGAIEKICQEKYISVFRITSDQVSSHKKWFKTKELLNKDKKTDIKKLEFIENSGIFYNSKNKKFYYYSDLLNSHETDAILIKLIGENNGTQT